MHVARCPVRTAPPEIAQVAHCVAAGRIDSGRAGAGGARAGGEYGPDRALPPGGVPVRAGQRIGWSGSSGAGPPHVHMEYRRGDTSVNPFVYGLSVRDTLAPRLERLVLEPLDSSLVARRTLPHAVWLGGRADTVVLAGRARAWVAAVGPGASGAKMAPYALSLAGGGSP